MKAFKTILAAVLGSVLLSSALTLFAAPPVRVPKAPEYDVKTFPGSMCQPFGLTRSDDLVYGVNSVGVPYSYDTPEYVACPIVRDDATGTDGIKWGRVSVSDNDPNYDVECFLRAYDIYGYFIAEVYDSTSGTPGDNILDLDLQESAEYGTYSLHCTIPPFGKLKSYRIYEWEKSYDDMTDYDN